MLTLRIHTHCQVAQNSQRTDRNLSKSMAALTHGMTENIKHENTTMCIVHAGFVGFRSFVGRNIGRCKLIGNRIVIPHDTIHSTLCSRVRKRQQHRKKNETE
jgi:hypothetical protein